MRNSNCLPRLNISSYQCNILGYIFFRMYQKPGSVVRVTNACEFERHVAFTKNFEY